MNTVEFIRGTNGKPVASKALEVALSSIGGLSGVCFFGFPLIATPEGKSAIDAMLVSPEKGVVLFDLVEGTELSEYTGARLLGSRAPDFWGRVLNLAIHPRPFTKGAVSTGDE